jgi:hypothetical protein
MTQLTCDRSFEDRLHAPAGWLLCCKIWCDERTSCFVARWSGGWDWFAKWALWSDRFLMDGSHCCPGGFVRWRVVEWCIALRCHSWVSGWIIGDWKQCACSASIATMRGMLFTKWGLNWELQCLTFGLSSADPIALPEHPTDWLLHHILSA